MKILHIEDFFHPDAGYQINILCKHMAKMGHEVVILTAQMDKVPIGLTNFFGRENTKERDAAYMSAYGVRIIRLPIKRFISGRAVFEKSLFKTIQAESPDVVYIHGNDTLIGISYLLRYKQMGFPLIMDSHMLAMASHNKFSNAFHWFYRHFLTPKIIKNHIWIIRTQNDPFVQQKLGIPLEQAPWISVGSDTLLFQPDYEARKAFRQQHNIPEDAFVVVYAGKLSEDKGGMLLANAIKEKLPSAREIVFVVVGQTVGEYGREVEAIFSESENRILRFPTQKYTDLAKFYQMADLAVFPRQCSLSFYDVQACGLPVLFEDNNINTDRCKHNNGLTFISDDATSMRDKLLTFIEMGADEFYKMGQNGITLVKNSYDYADIAKQYMSYVEDAVTRYYQ